MSGARFCRAWLGTPICYQVYFQLVKYVLKLHLHRPSFLRRDKVPLKVHITPAGDFSEPTVMENPAMSLLIRKVLSSFSCRLQITYSCTLMLSRFPCLPDGRSTTNK